MAMITEEMNMGEKAKFREGMKKHTAKERITPMMRDM